MLDLTFNARNNCTVSFDVRTSNFISILLFFFRNPHDSGPGFIFCYHFVHPSRNRKPRSLGQVTGL